MVETLSVIVSGTALTYLQTDSLSHNYQEGFLLGEVNEKETKTITDNDQQQTNIARTIRVRTSVICPSPHYFYDGAGNIIKERVQSLLGDSQQKVVGWFKYRHNLSNLNFTFREKLIHQNLIDFFRPSPQLFTCCHLSTDFSENCSTHSFFQNFLVLRNNTAQPIPMHIISLGIVSNSYVTPEPMSDAFAKIIQGLKINCENQNISAITKIQSATEVHLKHLIQKLAKVEERLSELEENVKVRNEVKKKKILNAALSLLSENQLDDDKENCKDNHVGSNSEIKAVKRQTAK